MKSPNQITSEHTWKKLVYKDNWLIYVMSVYVSSTR